MDYNAYGYEPTYKPIRIKTMIDNIGSQNKYDVSLVNPYTNGFFSIRENGDIEMFADNMLGIRIRKSDSSVNIYASQMNIHAQTHITSPSETAELKLLDQEDGSFLSQKADYIGINSDREIMIGNYLKEKDSTITISMDKIYLNASEVIVNGKSLKTE